MAVDLTGSADGLFKRGNTFYQSGRLKEALNDLNRLVQQDSGFQNAYYLRGKIRFGNKEKVKMIPKKVELQILKEIKKNPKYVNITDEGLKGILYGSLNKWVLEWWRTEGILEKK